MSKATAQIYQSLELSTQHGRNIYICDQTQNPTGSHKDRSFETWIKKINQQGVGGAVISSSGNAAISASYFAQPYNIPLTIFISPNISPEKLSRLNKVVQQNSKIQVRQVKHPIFEANKFAKENNCVWLRSSTSDDALLGYQILAQEIDQNLPDLGSIFIPASSGTLTVGVHQYLISQPQFHIVQTSKINTLVRKYDQDYRTSKISLADSIVDLIGHRKKDVEKIIDDSGGWGWVIEDEAIQKAQEELKSININCSGTSALSLAGLQKAIKANFQIKEPTLLIIS